MVNIVSVVNTPSNQIVNKTDLRSELDGKGASLVGIKDAGGYYSGHTVEEVLQEVGEEIGGVDASKWESDGTTHIKPKNSKQVKVANIDGALSAVSTDSTLTGSGTSASPLSVVSSGGGGDISILATITGVDFSDEVPEPLLLYTVPEGKSVVIERVIMRCTDYDAGVSQRPSMKGGFNDPTYDDWTGNQGFFTAYPAGKFSITQRIGPSMQIGTEGDEFKMAISDYADATFVVDIDIIGYLL